MAYTEVKRYVNILPLLAPLITAVGAGLVLQNYVKPYLIWGGTDCTTAHAVQSCAGYPPTGIAVLLVGSLLAWGGLFRAVDRLATPEVFSR